MRTHVSFGALVPLPTTDSSCAPSLSYYRAPSPSGLTSPSRLPGSRERDWENGSNASSPASVPEYTGKQDFG
jgi:hypothetical protein